MGIDKYVKQLVLVLLVLLLLTNRQSVVQASEADVAVEIYLGEQVEALPPTDDSTRPTPPTGPAAPPNDPYLPATGATVRQIMLLGILLISTGIVLVLLVKVDKAGTNEHIA